MRMASFHSQPLRRYAVEVGNGEFECHTGSGTISSDTLTLPYRAPSIIWQAAWNYIAGPYLLWKIRMIRDIYNWRLQTTLAILASLPGTPFWLAAVYSNSLNGVSKYWVPPMWYADLAASPRLCLEH